MTLSGAIAPGQSEPGNKGLLSISESSSITEAQPLDCLVSYFQDTRCIWDLSEILVFWST